MTILNSPHLAGDTSDRQAALITVADIVSVLKQSNHATAFAAWTVATIAMGLVIQVDSIRAVSHLAIAPLLFGGLIVVLCAVSRVVVLLLRAGRAATVDGLTGEAIGGAARSVPSADQAWETVRSLTVAARTRDALARRALIWAYGSGIGFLTWSLIVAVLAVA